MLDLDLEGMDLGDLDALLLEDLPEAICKLDISFLGAAPTPKGLLSSLPPPNLDSPTASSYGPSDDFLYLPEGFDQDMEVDELPQVRARAGPRAAGREVPSVGKRTDPDTLYNLTFMCCLNVCYWLQQMLLPLLPSSAPAAAPLRPHAHVDHVTPGPPAAPAPLHAVSRKEAVMFNELNKLLVGLVPVPGEGGTSPAAAAATANKARGGPKGRAAAAAPGPATPPEALPAATPEEVGRALDAVILENARLVGYGREDLRALGELLRQGAKAPQAAEDDLAG
jgi:hypothetical protein